MAFGRRFSAINGDPPTWSLIDGVGNRIKFLVAIPITRNGVRFA
jgi:hypothetical protein